MKKYIIIYKAPMSAMEQMANAKPEDMSLWMDWAKRCGDGLVDIGTPLGPTQKMSKSGTTPGDTSIVGYSILQAESMDAAEAMMKDHPHLMMADGCEIEIHEALPLPQ